jgi:hypothetical protein
VTGVLKNTYMGEQSSQGYTGRQLPRVLPYSSWKNLKASSETTCQCTLYLRQPNKPSRTLQRKNVDGGRREAGQFLTGHRKRERKTPGKDARNRAVWLPILALHLSPRTTDQGAQLKLAGSDWAGALIAGWARTWGEKGA